MADNKSKKVVRKKKLKVFDLLWLCDSISEMETFHTRRMFGGLSIYLHNKMVLCLMEDPGTQTYRDTDFGIDIWNGLLVATDRASHPSLIQEFPGLQPHPVISKWLYIHMDHKDFENQSQEILMCVEKNDPRIGIYPQPKKAKKLHKA